MHRYLLLIAFLVLLIGISKANPVLGETTVRVVPGKALSETGDHIRNRTHIAIYGHIRESAVAKLAAALPEARRAADSFNHDNTPVVRVLLNSDGGEVLAAIRLGQLLRRNGAEVWVLPDSTCSSACVLVLAGGVSRVVSPGARIGIHRPYFTSEEFSRLSFAESQDSYRKLSLLVRDYLSEMGIDNSLFTAMMRIESRNMTLITDEFAQAVQLDGEEPAHQEWQRAKAIGAIGQSRLEALERFSDCINAQKPESECKKHLSGW